MGMYGKPITTLDCSKDEFGNQIGSMTKQSFADEVDINKVVARYEKTGMLDHVNRRQPFYGDVSEIRSYQESLNVVIHAVLIQIDAIVAMTDQCSIDFHGVPLFNTNF